MDKKISVIGLDGANINIVNQMKIQNFSNFHDLISTIPPYTPPSWTSIITGVNPGKHGIYGFQKFSKGSNDVHLNTSKDVKSKRIFEILDKLNLKSIYINLPLTYPFTGIQNKENSIILSDWASPKQAIYPSKIHNKFEGKLTDPPHNWKNKGNVDVYIDKINCFLDDRLNVYEELIHKYEWDLFFIVFSEIDWILHRMPLLLHGEKNEKVLIVFEKINKFIQKSVQLSDVTFIVSDHGFEKKHSLFHVNELLKRNKIIQGPKLKSNIVSKSYNLMPTFVKKSIIPHLNNKSILKYQTNLSDNKAIMIEPENWGIYINDCEEKIIEILKKQPEIIKILKRDEIYNGNYKEYSPDVFLVPKPGVKYSNKFSKSLKEDIEIGDHEIHGVFGVLGKNIKKDISFNEIPTVYDIVPTILHMFGLPIPKDIDGKVLKEIFKEDSESYQRKIIYPKNETEEGKIKNEINLLKKIGKI